MTAKRLLARFFRANRGVAQRVEALLPMGFRVNLHRRYEQIVSQQINASPHQVVVDVGAGRRCPYLRFLDQDLDTFIVGVDNSRREIGLNQDISAGVVADVTVSLPLRDGSVDIVTSRSVLEHLEDTASFIAQCHRVLIDGGTVIQSCPCRFSPFSLINQILPNAISKKLIDIFHPEWTDDCGFRAYYDNCWQSRFVRILKENGFDVVETEFRYYQAIYFDFFLPLYICMLLYDLSMYFLGAQDLACQMLIVARKRLDMPLGVGQEKQCA